MVSKECGISLILSIIVTLIVSIIFWFSFHPSKPSFILQDATVFAFNVSGKPPNLITSNIQTTLISSNPSHMIGIYYDRLDVYASYQNQQFTLATSIPSTYQGHGEVNVWSPFFGGRFVPIDPSNALSLGQEQTSGGVKVVVQVDGLFRWKVGPFTRTSNIHVRCPAYIYFFTSSTGVGVGGKGVYYTLNTVCSVSV
ncbi:hypothetical protein N665_0293s0052 [Sinapis alba]|nr:hypothetical protein N665_0293s0052 [Sinapis alba]